MARTLSVVSRKWSGWLTLLIVTSIVVLVIVAAQPAKAASSLNLEAEKMYGSGKVFPDRAASNNKGRTLYKNSGISKQFNGSANSITVRARGDRCDGAPRMVVKVDGKTAISRLVDANKRWRYYSASLNVSGGGHKVTTQFVNNRKTRKCDRNLRVDNVRLKFPALNFPAESMTLSPSNAGGIYTDSVARDGRYLYSWSGSTASKDYTLPKGAYRVIMRAKGQQCDGAPHMVVRADGREVTTHSVSSTTWRDYEGQVDFSTSGQHKIDIVYDNDYRANGCDRNLLLDHVSFQAVSSVSEPGVAPEPGSQVILRDDFDGASLDRNLWTTPDHPLGHGYVRGQNVSVSGGKLYLKMPANSLDGGVIQSTRKYQYGSYTTRMKAPPTSDTYLAPFLYITPDFHSEIDIEVHNNGSRTTFFNTYEGPEVNPPDTIQQYAGRLPFDPSAGFHDYRWDYAPNYVKFYVDGVLYKTINDRIPPSEMYLYVTAFWPKQFQSPQKLATDLYAEVEYVEVRSLPNETNSV